MERIGVIPGPFRTGPEVSENTRTGAESRWRWTGSAAEVTMQRNFMRSQNIYSQITMRPLGDGDYEVVGEWPYDEYGFTPGPVPSVHELEVETACVDFRQSLKLQSLLTASQIAKLVRISDTYKTAVLADGQTNDALEATARADCVAISNTYGSKFFDDYACHGTDQSIEYRNVYRITLTAATYLQTRASFVGKGQIWTTAEIRGFEYIPSDIFFDLPNDSLWLKNPPHVQATHAQKTQVIYSYSEIKSASALLYYAYGSAVLN